jgi:hypothetical protein
MRVTVSSAIDVYQATGSSVASAATGPELAADAAPVPLSAIAPATQGSWDITALVSDWIAGGNPNDGLVIQAPAAGTAGIAYYSPSASNASDRPQLAIGYIPPAAPSAPASLTVSPGDGSGLVTWTEPSWNYDDETDSATASFTVNAVTTGGTVAATQTTDGNTAVLTGLTNGTPYTISITATNPIGTGPAATSASFTPAAVQGGPSQYISAVSQYLNAQDAIDSGTATLANTLAMPAPGGSVTVFVTANEAFTTIDNSTGSPVSVPGSASNDYLFSFTNPGSAPQLTGYVDADAALSPIVDGSDQTAFSDVLDGPAITAADQDAPAPLATDDFGQRYHEARRAGSTLGGRSRRCCRFPGPRPWPARTPRRAACRPGHAAGQRADQPIPLGRQSVPPTPLSALRQVPGPALALPSQPAAPGLPERPCGQAPPGIPRSPRRGSRAT